MQALFFDFSRFFCPLSGLSEPDGAAELLDHVPGGADHPAQPLFPAALVRGDDHAQRRADDHARAHALEK